MRVRRNIIGLMGLGETATADDLQNGYEIGKSCLL
jgi:hypothetical protein